MVKPDVQRDYYADLGLTPSADLEDIKKQYKKLGMATGLHSLALLECL
jgi:DnaJ-class molecular chaperone